MAVASRAGLSPGETASIYTLSITVTDTENGAPLCFATVDAGQGPVLTDVDGRLAMRLHSTRYSVKVSYIGYKNQIIDVNLKGDTTITVKLEEEGQMLKEVVISAREGTGLSSGSRIDRAAMEHLQPSSFTDLLELLPGNISKDPDMGSANSITLRETGSVSATGAKTAISDDYAITSLGTAFVVDGVPVNTDSNMQEVPSSASDAASAKRSSVNRGVDMRTISTDNIESVDVVRGIPSAEYGNLSSGLVNIKRTKKASPLSARFKADGFSKLFSVGKGFGLRGHNHIINADLSWLDSKIDPRDNMENYKRLTASLRGGFEWRRDEVSILWNVGTDYTGSFDNAKTDPDLNFNKIDEFESHYNRISASSELSLRFLKALPVSTLALTTSVSLDNDVIERSKEVAPQRASVAPTSMEEGEYDGVYLTREYLADLRSESRPLSFFAKLRAEGNRASGISFNEYKTGADISITKNYGKGQIYDLTRPLSASWTTRPLAFSDIPSLSVVSFYAEDNTTFSFGFTKLQTQLGLRGISMPFLDSRYDMSGRVYLDPRLNMRLAVTLGSSSRRPLTLSVAGGYGTTTRMPTADYLFPQNVYTDLLQLNYYDATNPDTHSLINLRTYIDSPVNYHLRPARNHKWEMRLGADRGGNHLSVIYFLERMRDGFRYTPVFVPRSYRRYDASAIDATALQDPPELSQLPYSDVTVLDGMRRVANGSRIDKQGIEFQLSTVRWQAMHTSLIVTGAWLRSRYSNSQQLYQTVNDVVGNRPVSDIYVGLYDTNDGRVNEQFNTNFMFDTQIPRWGLTFSSTLQCMWWLKTTRLRENGVPVAYMSADGSVRPFTAAAVEADPVLQYLVKVYNDDAFRTMTVPTALYFNLKVSKQIGRWLRLSAFVNRLFDYLPDYSSNGITIRRSADAYFGMEARINFDF